MKRAAWAVSCGLVAIAVAGVAGLGSALSQPLSPQHGGARSHERVRPAGRWHNSPTATSAISSRANRESFAVGLRVVRFVDRSRVVRLPGGESVPRVLVTYVRYPALGKSAGSDVSDAPAARGSGPFPLIVFGHGYAVTPAPYANLLRAWARAGYVVAAPVFPLENANAPGGPNEADLANQPADMRFVISRIVAASNAPTNALQGMVDATRIAVAGHSDGGETALAVAYDRRFRDGRIRAAVILSGAQIPEPGFTFPPGSPPLLAIQGTADSINPPSLTSAFYKLARRPKFLLTLEGAEHLPPYSYQQPQLGIVERVTIAFLDHYFKRSPLQRLITKGNIPRVTHLESDP